MLADKMRNQIFEEEGLIPKLNRDCSIQNPPWYRHGVNNESSILGFTRYRVITISAILFPPA